MNCHLNTKASDDVCLSTPEVRIQGSQSELLCRMRKGSNFLSACVCIIFLRINCYSDPHFRSGGPPPKIKSGKLHSVPIRHQISRIPIY